VTWCNLVSLSLADDFRYGTFMRLSIFGER